MASPSLKVAPEQARGPTLNPDMVYRPATPTSEGSRLLAASFPNDDDDDDHPPSFKIPLNLLLILRFAVAICAFADWILWSRRLADVFMVLIWIELALLTLWSLYPLAKKLDLPKRLFPGTGRCFPKGGITWQIGPLKCILGPPDEDDGGDGPDGGDEPGRKRSLRLGWVVDLYFAVSLLVFSVVQTNRNWSWLNLRLWRRENFIVLYIIVAFEFIIVIVSLLNMVLKHKSVAIVIHAKLDSAEPVAYRIRLPQEEDVRALRGQQISVAA